MKSCSSCSVQLLAMSSTSHAAINHITTSLSVELPLPYLPPPPPPPPPPVPTYDATFQSKISPSILLIILILAVIFFVSGLLHLIVRYLLRPAARGPEDTGANATAFQGQLQQLFHLHDAGVDQGFIDMLPVFLYRAIVGGGGAVAVAGGAGKDPFDCAVCLCEFAGDDRLRLLPKCSHAFHVECIDTWLLSHSTCPLCRRSLLADFSPYGSCSPLVFVLESGSESSRELAASERLEPAPSSRHLGLVVEEDDDALQEDGAQKQAEVAAKDEMVVPVKLGKFRSTAEISGSLALEGSGRSSGEANLDQRRCYSMGSYEYVMDETSLLQVAVKPPAKKRPPVSKSECDCHSKREGFKFLDTAANANDGDAKLFAVLKKESFSVSKTWLRAAKDRALGARRAASFRMSLQRAAAAGDEAKRRGDVSPVTESEYNVSAWERSEKSGSAGDWDMEAAASVAAGGNGLTSRADEAPSFARRTLLWIRGHL